MHTYRFANLVFSFEDGRLRHDRGGPEVSLRPQAARLLRHLIAQAGEVVPREQLYDAVWGDDAVVDFESGLAALMRELRQAIRSAGGPDGLIETVPRRGYRLDVRSSHDSRRRPAWLVGVALAALITVAVVAAFGIWLVADDAVPERETDYSLAILPFEHYAQNDDLPEHIGLLMADSLLAELLIRPVAGLDLIGRTSLRPYVDREDVVSSVAADLGVDLLIEGAVTGHPEGGWRAELRLLSVPPGRVLWSTTEHGDPGASLDARTVAAAMAKDLVEAWPALRGR